MQKKIQNGGWEINSEDEYRKGKQSLTQMGLRDYYHCFYHIKWVQKLGKLPFDYFKKAFLDRFTIRMARVALLQSFFMTHVK